MKKLLFIFTIFLILIVSAQTEPLNVYLFKGPTAISMVKMISDSKSSHKDSSYNYNIVNSPDIMVARIISGEADIAALPVSLAAKLYNKGIDYKLAVLSGYGLLYLLSSDPSIKSINDLNGKDLYNSGKGVTPEFILDYLLKTKDLKPKSISYKFKHIELAQALINGIVKTAVLPEPFVTKVLQANNNIKVISDLQKEWESSNPDFGKYPMTCFIIKNSVLNKKSIKINTFFDGFKNSINWILNNKEKASELVELNKFGFNYDEALESLNRLNFCYVVGTELKKLLDNYFSLILKESPKLIGAKIPDSNFYYNAE